MTLQLTPMTRAEFAAWRDGAQGDLADELVAVGTEAVVHDALVEAPWRGLGLGRELMESIEAFIRDEGATSVVFRIFGRNRAGKTLCESLGYQVASTTMRKSLGAVHPRG